MTMTPDVAALRIAPTLLDAERDIDALIAKIGALLGQVAGASLEMHAPALASQRPIANLTAALDKLGTVRGELVFAHSNLVKGYRDLQEPDPKVTADFPMGCPGATKPSAESVAA